MPNSRKLHSKYHSNLLQDKNLSTILVCLYCWVLLQSPNHQSKSALDVYCFVERKYRGLELCELYSSGKPRNLLMSLTTGVASPGWYGRRDSTSMSAIVWYSVCGRAQYKCFLTASSSANSLWWLSIRSSLTTTIKGLPRRKVSNMLPEPANSRLSYISPLL